MPFTCIIRCLVVTICCSSIGVPLSWSQLAALEPPVPGRMEISRADLDSSGFSTIGDRMRSLPIVSGPSLSSVDTGTSFTPGVSSVNLRGLGNHQGLVLLNRRRMVPYASPGFNGFQTVIDFSSIPKSAVESIEILKTGASGIHGENATSGVININLLRYFEGVEARFGMGDSVYAGGLELNFSTIGGFQAGRLNMVLTIDYRHRDPIYARHVPWTKTVDGRAIGGFDSRSSANISANVRGLDPAAYLIDPAGNPWDPGNQRFPSGRASLMNLPEAFAADALPGSGITPALEDFDGTNKLYNFQERTGLFPKEENLSLFSRLGFSLFDHLEAYLEASFFRQDMEVEAAPTPAFFRQDMGDSPQGTLVMPAGNPYNPFGVDLTDLRWRIVQAGNRINDMEVETPRILLGLEGNLPIGNWTFDTAGLYTESKVTNLNRNSVFDSSLQSALNGVIIDGELLYANPFGLSDERVIDYISGNKPHLRPI
jgi:iron complex outermembrane receptor protein